MDIEQKQGKLIDHFVTQASALKAGGVPSAAVALIGEATSNPNLFAFSEILNVPNILLQLEGTEYSAYLDVLRLFAHGTWGDYKSNAACLPRLVPDQVLKLKQPTVLTLAETNKVLPYDQLILELDVMNARELEDFLINECMHMGIVRGKLDQLRRCFKVRFAAGRDLRSRQLRTTLVYGEESISRDELLSKFPSRNSQINDLLQLLGPPNSPMLPMFVYGGPSTGKTSIILQLFRHLSRPFVYTSCRTCYSPRVLFESILNQLSLHRPNEDNGYSSSKRCEKPSEFINLLRDASVGLVKSLEDKTSDSKPKFPGEIDGSMVYLIIDNIDLVLEWDKCSSILPFLFSLYDMLEVPEVGIIYISSVSPDMFYSATGSLEPVSIFFPAYSDEDVRHILMRDRPNQKLYSSFLDIVLRPFCRITRRLDELSTVFSSLFTQYCKPLGGKQTVPNEDMKRRLFSHLQPHISPCMNETFQVAEKVHSEAETSKSFVQKRSRKMLGSSECPSELDFHMCTSARYLLISAFLASRNPATLDASLFDSCGGPDGCKKRRKISEKSKGLKEAEEEESLTKGPGSFPLERLIAIFQCLVSVAEDPLDEQEDPECSLGIQSGGNALASTLLLQLSSLCNSNFLVKGGSCPLEGSTRYRSMVSEDLALMVARSINFPLAKYIYRR